jgi:hypothetical protein
MKLPKYKIESAVADEGSRYALHAAYCDVESKTLVATDGHQLAVVPCEPEPGDKSGIVPKRAFDLARAAQRRVPKKLRPAAGVKIGMNAKILVRSPHTGETFVVPRGEGKFPQWKAVVPKMTGAPDLVIDIEVLLKAVQAIQDPERAGADGGSIALWIDKGKKPATGAILVAPAFHEPNRLAIIMPMAWHGPTAEKVIQAVLGKPEPARTEA